MNTNIKTKQKPFDYVLRLDNLKLLYSTKNDKNIGEKVKTFSNHLFHEITTEPSFLFIKIKTFAQLTIAK